MTDEVPFPLVDLSCLGPNVTENELGKIGKKIVEGFQQNGYIYLSNHNLLVEDVRKLTMATNQFFDFEEDFKQKYKRNMETFHGYTTGQEETLQQEMLASSKAIRNAFDIEGLDEPLPNEEIPQMREAAKSLLDVLLPLVVHLLRCLEIGLDLKENILVNSHRLMMTRDNVTDLRSLRYLPPEHEEQVNRLGAHCDVSTITLQLFDDLEGLELLDKNNVWQKSKLYPGYILLFPSEVIQMLTGDKIKALKHRVVIPKDEAVKKLPRHSMILFVHADNDVIIKPLDGSKKYEPMSSINIIRNKAKLYYNL